MTKRGWAEWQESFKKGEPVREITRYPERKANGEIPDKFYIPILPQTWSRKDILAGLSFQGSYVRLTVISQYDTKRFSMNPNNLDLSLVKWSFRIHRKDIRHVVVERIVQTNKNCSIYTFL